MWLEILALLGFLLVVIFFIIIRMAIAHHYKNVKRTESKLLFFIDTNYIREVTDGPLAKLIVELHDQHKTPQIKLFVFTPQVDLVAIRNQLPEPLKKMLPESYCGPFAYPLRWSSAKFSIFFPEQWLHSGLSEKAIHLIICHEAGHIVYRRRETWLGLSYYIGSLFSQQHSRNYFDEKLYDKKDSWANTFSERVMGREKTIQLLEEIRDNLKHNSDPLDQSQDEHLNHHIAEIRETIRQQNPLKLF